MPVVLARPVRAIVAGALAGCLAMVAVACSSGGGGNKASACASMQASIQKLNQTALTQTSDPVALAKTYHDGASEIRNTANGASGSVKTSGLQVADALDGLGDGVAKLVGSTSPQMPSVTPLTNAGVALQKACT
jgi:hypothetical protein